MKKQILLFLGFIFISAYVAPAQKRIVTNADLEKFRQTRVRAEQDYRENYQKLGLPSPEELEKRREQNRRELSELSERLQIESAEREQRQREDEYRQAQARFLLVNSNQYNQAGYGGSGYYPFGFSGAYSFYGYSGGFYGGYHNNNRFGRRRNFGGGNFYNSVFPEVGFPSQGVRINTNGVRINVTGGGSRSPIRNPR